MKYWLQHDLIDKLDTLLEPSSLVPQPPVYYHASRTPRTCGCVSIPWNRSDSLVRDDLRNMKALEALAKSMSTVTRKTIRAQYRGVVQIPTRLSSTSRCKTTWKSDTIWPGRF